MSNWATYHVQEDQDCDLKKEPINPGGGIAQSPHNGRSENMSKLFHPAASQQRILY